MPKYHQKKTVESDLVTDLIRGVLRLASKATKHGNELVKDLGLTSARWQTLGEIYFLESAITVSELSRRMGLSRQAVQRLTNEMAQDRLIVFKKNQEDARADLVVLTQKGKRTYVQSLDGEWEFTNRLASGLAKADLQITFDTIDRLIKKFDSLTKE